MLLGTKKNQEVYRDTLVIISTDGTADIVPVIDRNEERILGSGYDQEYAIPNGDVKSLTGPKGRIFVYPSTVENIADCQRIARLEKSTTLNKLTEYEEEQPDDVKTFDLSKYISWFIILILILFLGFKH